MSQAAEGIRRRVFKRRRARHRARDLPEIKKKRAGTNAELTSSISSGVKVLRMPTSTISMLRLWAPSSWSLG